VVAWSDGLSRSWKKDGVPPKHDVEADSIHSSHCLALSKMKDMKATMVVLEN